MNESDGITLDDLDRQILNLVQKSIPLETRPFRALAELIGISEAEVLRRLEQLRENGIVRRLGPIINYASWGMSGVLVAANLDRSSIETARRVVQDYPEITHAYIRDHPWNFWFTVVAENEEAVEAIIQRVIARTGLQNVQRLERKKTFKLKVKFEA